LGNFTERIQKSDHKLDHSCPITLGHS